MGFLKFKTMRQKRHCFSVNVDVDDDGDDVALGKMLNHVYIVDGFVFIQTS